MYLLLFQNFSTVRLQVFSRLPGRQECALFTSFAGTNNIDCANKLSIECLKTQSFQEILGIKSMHSPKSQSLVWQRHTVSNSPKVFDVSEDIQTCYLPDKNIPNLIQRGVKKWPKQGEKILIATQIGPQGLLWVGRGGTSHIRYSNSIWFHDYVLYTLLYFIHQVTDPFPPNLQNIITPKPLELGT